MGLFLILLFVGPRACPVASQIGQNIGWTKGLVPAAQGDPVVARWMSVDEHQPAYFAEWQA